jgi:hypothetical protein
MVLCSTLSHAQWTKKGARFTSCRVTVAGVQGPPEDGRGGGCQGAAPLRAGDSDGRPLHHPLPGRLGERGRAGWLLHLYASLEELHWWMGEGQAAGGTPPGGTPRALPRLPDEVYKNCCQAEEPSARVNEVASMLRADAQVLARRDQARRHCGTAR